MDLHSSQNSKQILKSRHYTAWQLISLYWKSEYKVSAYLFFAVILVLTVTLVGFDVAFNYWYNYFYNALQAYNLSSTLKLLVVFCILAAFYIVIAVYRYYISQLFALGWRRWLTDQVLNRWLEKRAYYYLETFDVKTDNPDQRIQEDINSLISSSISLVVGLVSAVTTFPAFIYILWTLSGVLSIPLGSLGTLHIYGYLVWVGLIYNLIGTLITFKIGFPLVNLNFEQQQREATFRFSAIDLRSHAEQVALYRGENHQKNILNFHFIRVLENWYAIILRQKLLLWFTAGFNQVAILLPLMAALPNYFGKVFLLGGLMQTISAFGRVQDSLSYLVTSYTQIAEWRAITLRLTSFLNHLSDSEALAKKADQIDFQHNTNNAITIKNLTINTANNEVLLGSIEEDFLHGQNYVIKGESGIGKSTFIKTLAGVWPYASGTISLPKHNHIMYLPQKPYMPMGTLAEAILFPDKKNPELEKHLEKAMHDCHLSAFISRLQESAHWSEQLSPGEQQRIAFARVLIHKPDWVFLDESTSMLDLANEKHLYNILHERLPQCSIITVAHHASVDDFHDHVLNMSKYSQASAMA